MSDWFLNKAESTCVNGTSARQSFFIILAVFVLSFLVYNLNFSWETSGDNVPNRLIPLSIIENKTVFLNKFYPDMRIEDKSKTLDGKYYYRVTGQRLVAEKSTFFSILITPVYAAFYFLLGIIGQMPDFERVFEVFIPKTVYLLDKLTASSLASIANCFVFAGIYAWRKSLATALFVTLIYGFGSSHWSVSSQGLWVHGGLELLLAVMLWGAFSALNNPRREGVYLAIASAAAAFMLPVRLTGGAFTLAWLAYLFVFHRRYFWNGVSCTALSWSVFFTFNMLLFGALVGGYSVITDSFMDYGFKENIRAWAGMFISPGRGLFFYSPVFLLSIAGLYRLLKRPGASPLLLFLLPAAFLVFLAHATYTDGHGYLRWFAGHSYGPRYFVDMFPFLAYLLPIGFESLSSSVPYISRAVLIALLSWSVFTQFVGTFFYKNNHNALPVDIDSNPSRVWNLNDNPVSRELKTGLNPNTREAYVSLGLIEPRLLRAGASERIEFREGTFTLDAWVSGGEWVAFTFRDVKEGVLSFDIAGWSRDTPQLFKVKGVGGYEKEYPIVKDRIYRIEVPVPNDGPVEIKFFAEPWVPRDVIRGSRDGRRLGVVVFSAYNNGEILYKRD